MNLIDQLNIQPFVSTDKGYQAQMKLTDFHAQPLGYLNGGATLAFCEITAGMASNQLISDDHFAVGQSVSAQHLNPTRAQGILTAKSTLLHKGHRSHVWDIKVYDDQQILISQVTVVNAIIKK